MPERPPAAGSTSGPAASAGVVVDGVEVVTRGSGSAADAPEMAVQDGRPTPVASGRGRRGRQAAGPSSILHGEGAPGGGDGAGSGGSRGSGGGGDGPDGTQPGGRVDLRSALLSVPTGSPEQSDGDADREYRVDDLARAAGTSVRNVRVYQDRGLLPPPRRQGRIGWYSQAHLERLLLIGRLLERGYTFATIGELLEAWHAGGGLERVLGVREAISGPWSDEEPGRISRAELDAFFASGDDGTVARSVSLGLLVEQPDGSYSVPSPRLIAAGAALVGAGVPLSGVLDIAEGLRTHLTQSAKIIFGTVAAALLRGDDPSQMDDAELAETIVRLRPFAAQAAEATFALAMTQQAEELLAALGQSGQPGRSGRPGRPGRSGGWGAAGQRQPSDGPEGPEGPA